jgi:hypothetical protein
MPAHVSDTARPWEEVGSSKPAPHVPEGDRCREASAEEAIEYVRHLIASASVTDLCSHKN